MPSDLSSPGVARHFRVQMVCFGLWIRESGRIPQQVAPSRAFTAGAVKTESRAKGAQHSSHTTGPV